jgi:glycosyltransferase involved in cell wall biosynthesis
MPMTSRLHVVQMIDSLASGGAERSLAELAPHLVQGGVRLSVVLLHDRPGMAPQMREAGASVQVLDGATRPAWLRSAWTLLRTTRPDLVHTTLFDADVVGRVAAHLTRVPVVSSIVNMAYGPEHLAEANLWGAKVRAAQLADLSTARLVERFRAVSAGAKEAGVQRLRIPAERIEIIPEGRDAAGLGKRTPQRRAAARAELGITDEPLVLAVARHEPQKGLDVLLRSMPGLCRAVPSVRLAVAGREGRSTAELRSLVQTLGIGDRVTFLGQRDDVAELLCAADVFVLPSRREGLPGAVQEAMALQAPIVASDISPVREVLGAPGTARLVPPDDPAALAAGLAEVLGDPAGARERAVRAREEFLSRYDAASVAERMLGFYKAAARSGRASAVRRP